MTETMLDHWPLVVLLAGLIASWSVIILTVSRIVFKNCIKDLNKKMDALAEEAQGYKKIEREVLELKAELPVLYVRREDFIRFDVGINYKLDKLRDLVVEAIKGK